MATDDKLRDLGQDGDDPAFASSKAVGTGEGDGRGREAGSLFRCTETGLMEAAETRRPAHRSPSPRVAIDHLWRTGP